MSKTVVAQEHTMSIKVIGANQDDHVQFYAFNVYADAILINTTETFLSNGTATLISVLWNTDGLVKDNYTISVYLEPIPAETYVMDNSFIENWVIIAMIGDITGEDGWPDGKCDMRDVGLVARNFAKNVPPAPANCDVTGPSTGVPDGKVDMRDIGLVARHFGETDP